MLGCFEDPNYQRKIQFHNHYNVDQRNARNCMLAKFVKTLKVDDWKEVEIRNDIDEIVKEKK